ncbi:MAG: ribbon-helix-helix domain-containing protein [bacterium]
MRSVVNISLPSTMTQEVKLAVKKEGFVSVSEFFRSLLRSWMEGKLLVELEQSREEIKAGKGKVLKSLKDLR